MFTAVETTHVCLYLPHEHIKTQIIPFTKVLRQSAYLRSIALLNKNDPPNLQNIRIHIDIDISKYSQFMSENNYLFTSDKLSSMKAFSLVGDDMVVLMIRAIFKNSNRITL